MEQVFKPKAANLDMVQCHNIWTNLRFLDIRLGKELTDEKGRDRVFCDAMNLDNHKDPLETELSPVLRLLELLPLSFEKTVCPNRGTFPPET